MTKALLITRAIYEEWKIIAEKIGNFQFSIIFSVFYFLLLTPFGVVSSFFNDFLKVKARPTWLAKKADSANLKQLFKQS